MDAPMKITATNDVDQNGRTKTATRTECGQNACSNAAEVSFEDQQWCRNHFFRIATKRLEECRVSLATAGTNRTQEGAIRKFLTELIAQSTGLAATARFLSPSEREQLLDISLSAAEYWRKLQDARQTETG
jgi:hypothetical protein